MEIEILTIFVALVVAIVALILTIFRVTYVVVPPQESHVVVNRGKGKKVYDNREGHRSSYWRIPIIQQRSILPIENIQIMVDDIPLRDKNMAKFVGDVVAWLNIIDPSLASERVGKIKDFGSIESDVKNVIHAVTRNMSMYWTIIDIITKRKEFSEDVEKSINEELKAWGMKMEELEVIHFIDTEGYTVIKDLEKRQATVINTETRKQVAEKQKEADIVESNAKRESEERKAENESSYRLKQIKKDEDIGKREQEKEQTVAEQLKKANEKKIEAEKIYKVGQAKIEKEAVIEKATGEGESIRIKGEKDSDVIKLKGNAEAEIIKSKGFADADATDKRAEALKKYNEAGIGLEVIKASQIVQIAQANAWAEAMKAAKIQVYSGGEGGNFFGTPLSPKGAFGLGAFAEIAKEHGLDVEKIAESLARGTLPVITTKPSDITGEKKKDVKRESDTTKQA